MSLFGLPVTVNDLIQLQQGLTFTSNTNAAQTEAAKINAGMDTVANYANTLLADQGDTGVDLSGVTMAVSALMEGSTIPVGDANTPNTLTLLSTVFLPPQAANAIAHSLPTTVYAAEALGLALSTLPGFQSFVNLDIDQFSQAVSTATGINSGAIKQWVTNWEGFYTAHPQNATSVTQAAYGAAFGDAVGVALANPTVNGTIALLVNEERNALIDNAEGSYQAGILLSAEPPHIPLQGEAFPIPNAGGGSLGSTIDWFDTAATQGFNYAQFIAPAQSGPLTIDRAPLVFTLDTQHFGTNNIEIDAATDVFGRLGALCTLILGDNTSGETLGSVTTHGYSTVEIVVADSSSKSPGDRMSGLATLTDRPPAPSDLVISGHGGSLLVNGLAAGSITDDGVSLDIEGGLEVFGKIDASHAPGLLMTVPAIPLDGTAAGVTVLGGSQGNILQGSLGQQTSTVHFSNGSTGLAHTFVGADNITGGSLGGDFIFGDGGADQITLPPNRSQSDTVIFGLQDNGSSSNVLAITDGNDAAYLGSWGASATPIPIPNLFPPGNTGGTSFDDTRIATFLGGDRLEFSVLAWNGASTGFGGFATQGDLVNLSGVIPVASGDAQLSAVWVNSSSNSALKTSDNVLRYAPSDASLNNASELAPLLHTSTDAVTLPGLIPPGAGVHILVAYNLAGFNFPVMTIADVDLVNTGNTPQNSTANVNIYASDMVTLLGVSLTDLIPANIHFTTNFF
jgi:hypothetical protein